MLSVLTGVLIGQSSDFALLVILLMALIPIVIWHDCLPVIFNFGGQIVCLFSAQELALRRLWSICSISNFLIEDRLITIIVVDRPANYNFLLIHSLRPNPGISHINSRWWISWQIESIQRGTLIRGLYHGISYANTVIASRQRICHRVVNHAGGYSRWVCDMTCG